MIAGHDFKKGDVNRVLEESKKGPRRQTPDSFFTRRSRLLNDQDFLLFDIMD
jgi:hypothetical protein